MSGGVLNRAGLRPRRRFGPSWADFGRTPGRRIRRLPVLPAVAERVFLRPARPAALVQHHHRSFHSHRLNRFNLSIGWHFPAAPRLTVNCRTLRMPARQSAESPVPAQLRPRIEHVISIRTDAGSPVVRRSGMAAAGGPRPAKARQPVPDRNLPISFRCGKGATHLLSERERIEIIRRTRNRRRVEDRSRGAVTGSVRRNPPPAPVPDVNRRPDDRPAAQPFPAARPDGGPGMGRNMAAAPQVDLQAVTNQVMRQIDRRLTAWRERTGR